MALRGNGQLLARVPLGEEGAVAAAVASHDFAPLSAAQHTIALTAAAPPGEPGAPLWMLATPSGGVDRAPTDPSPWNAAHAAAAATGYSQYFEPDILHERTVPPAPPATEAVAAPPPAAMGGGAIDPSHGVLFGGQNLDYPPATPNDGISPGWHLGAGYTNFQAAWATATGQGVRIAHLDTGYTPGHYSTPANMLTALSWDFWRNTGDVVDPGENFLGTMQPGHGTATLALLAGRKMELSYGQQSYSGPVGGAPDAEIVEVRIGPTVYHLYSSTMASGIYYALGPSGDPAHPNPANRCDVISISHGGLPTMAWADAVNAAYEAGVVIVAASGDNFYALVDFPTHYTVYPAAFNRVLTSVGATYTRAPYITTKLGVMQGCWGPNEVMEKAISAFTPNVPWMKYDALPSGFEMSGAGTSASTPQMAAACALWLQAYGDRLGPADWRRVEACRLAMFKGANKSQGNLGQLGQGLLDVPQMLRADLADDLIARVTATPPQIAKSQPDSVSFPFWRLLVGAPPPGADVEAQMYETEVAQVVLASNSGVLLAGLARSMMPGAAFDAAERAQYLDALRQQNISDALRARIA